MGGGVGWAGGGVGKTRARGRGKRASEKLGEIKTKLEESLLEMGKKRRVRHFLAALLFFSIGPII